MKILIHELVNLEVDVAEIYFEKLHERGQA